MGLGADLIVCDGWLGAGLLGGLGAFIAVPGLLGFGRGEAILNLAEIESYGMICPHWSVIESNLSLVESVHDKGIKVGVWVVPGSKIDTLRDLGVDAVISEELKEN